MSPPQQLRQQTSNWGSLLIYRPRKDERLSWPSWLTYSGWLTHISGHPSATGWAQYSESTSAKDQCSTAGPRNDAGHPLPSSRRLLSYDDCLEYTPFPQIDMIRAVVMSGGWRLHFVVARWSRSTKLLHVSTGMGDCLRAGKPTRFCNQPLRPTQLSTLSGTENEYQLKCGYALRLWNKGRYGSFHLWINMWVAGKTVWSLVNMCHNWAL